MKEERLVKVLLAAVCLSLFLSFFSIATVVHLKITQNNANINSYELQHIQKRAIEEDVEEDVADVPTVRDELRCHDDSLVFDKGTRRGYVNQKIHQLACNQYEVQLQVEGWVDEFNSVLYLINEIGVNMQAAKDNIIRNQNQIQLLLMMRDRSFNVTQHNLDDISNLMNVTFALQSNVGEIIVSQNLMFDALINQTESLEERLSIVSNYLPSPEKIQPAITNSSEYISPAEEVEHTTVINDDQNLGPILKGIDDRSQENNKLLLVLQNSVNFIRSELENQATEGWFNAPNGYQYYLSRGAFRTNSYTRSRRYCRNKNSDLAYVGIRDEIVFRFLYVNVIHPAKLSCVWIGLTDIEREGHWKWLDGMPIEDKWSNWRVKVQGLKAQTEDCAMVRGGYWDRENCGGSVKVCSFICERKIFN